LSGQEIRTLASGRQNAGLHTIKWDGKDRFGHEVGAGVYIYAVQTGREKLMRKLTVLQ
jgi:flagellar hook assembly protein FlgD